MGMKMFKFILTQILSNLTFKVKADATIQHNPKLSHNNGFYKGIQHLPPSNATSNTKVSAKPSYYDLSSENEDQGSSDIESLIDGNTNTDRGNAGNGNSFAMEPEPLTDKNMKLQDLEKMVDDGDMMSLVNAGIPQEKIEDLLLKIKQRLHCWLKKLQRRESKIITQ